MEAEVLAEVLAEVRSLRDGVNNIKTNHHYLGCLPSRDRTPERVVERLVVEAEVLVKVLA